MPTTLLRGSTGASSRTSARVSWVSVSETPTWSGSPARATILVSSAGMPSSSTSPVTTPYWGSSPVVNLAIRTWRAYRRPGRRSVPTLVAVETLDPADWTVRRAAHEARVDAWVQPHLARRRAHVAHPVEDFLFRYYTQRPAALRRWHPGYGIGLREAHEHATFAGYVERAGVATVDEDVLVARRPLLEGLRT